MHTAISASSVETLLAQHGFQPLLPLLPQLSENTQIGRSVAPVNPELQFPGKLRTDRTVEYLQRIKEAPLKLNKELAYFYHHKMPIEAACRCYCLSAFEPWLSDANRR
eukprot:m.10803 g.10803  ORF g.10803 m.10803 type:complete len:108 (+) comp22696_c0_seq2:673-996(+)